jgi:hypothetical protein
VPHGPVVEVSTLSSAGEGAPRTCPSGGCGPRGVVVKRPGHGHGRLHQPMWRWR